MQRTLNLLVLGTLMASIGVANANILTNGTLDVTYQQVIVDNAPPGPGPEDFFLPKPANWVNEGSRAITGPYEDEMSSEPWAGPAPTPVTTGGVGADDWAVFFKPFSGNVPTNGPATGHLYQDVAASPGLRYRMTGWAGAEANALMTDAQFALEFLNGGGTVIGGTVLSLLPTLFVDNGEAFDYKQYALEADAPAGTAFARVRASMIGALGNPAGGGQAFVIDDFSLTVVPEPGSAMLGLAGTLCVLRRARRR